MPKLTASERARRLVALLGQLKDGPAVRIERLAEQVGETPAQLAADLVLLSMCGVAPYSPYELVPVLVEDGMVEVFGSMPALTGPVRLSAAEAEALVAALQAAGFGADDPLLKRLLGASASDFDAAMLERTLRSSIGTHETGVFEVLAGAIAESEVLAIAYQREGAGEPGVRTVEPLQLFADRGAWYLSAWCRSAGDFRTFRVDRIRAVEPAGESFDAAARGSAFTDRAFVADNLPTARLAFAPTEAFSEREWPGGRMAETREDGTVVAEVPYAGTAWIARRVVARLGGVVVEAPDEVREAVAGLATAALSAL